VNFSDSIRITKSTPLAESVDGHPNRPPHFLTGYVKNREMEPALAGRCKNHDFAKACRALGSIDRLAEQHIRGNIAHRLSTTVGNLIAFFG
jgi:hypothetical protein